MNRALVWIGAAILAVGPLALVASTRPAANLTAAKPVSAYVLMDGPVAASTDDVTATDTGEGAEIGNGSGSLATSLAWTAAAGVLVLAAWAAVAAGDAAASRARRTVRGAVGAGRVARRGGIGSSWRYAVSGVARWATAAQAGK